MRGCATFSLFKKTLKEDFLKAHAGHQLVEKPISEAPTYYIIELRCTDCKKGLVTIKKKEKTA